MGDRRKQAATRLLEAYREYQRAQRAAWSAGKTTSDVAAYQAARAELEAAELAAMALCQPGAASSPACESRCESAAG